MEKDIISTKVLKGRYEEQKGNVTNILQNEHLEEFTVKETKLTFF